MPDHPMLYAASVEPLRDERLYARALQAASPARREKAARLARPEDRRLSLGAELLLRRALADAGAQFPAHMETGPHGKPFAPGLGICFNLSHSGEYALCAVCESEIGCDIEKIGPAPLDVAKRFFPREEYIDILSQPTPALQNERFFLYWTIRESYMKAVGTGLSLPQDAFRVCAGETIRIIPDEKARSFRAYVSIPGYIAAVCAETDLSRTELTRLELTSLLSPPGFAAQ